MAVDNTKELVKKEVDAIGKNAEVNEAYFVGLLWANPLEAYGEYSDKISYDEFIHGVWGFYYELGRRMFDEGIKTFDNITVAKMVKDLGVEGDFKEYGGKHTIDDAVSIVKSNSDNIDYYYETIKKNYNIKQLHLLFGDKILLKKNKYDYKKMNREQLITYWSDKLNALSLGNVNNYEAEDLFIEGEEFIRKLEEESAEMLPFYKSVLMNNVTQGVARGHVFMWGGFGNSGKSSMMADKFVMSCITNNEKLLIVLNEEDAQSFRQKIVLSILNHEFKTQIDRKRMVNGKLTPEDRVLIMKAFNRWKEMIEGENALIKVIFMERYVISDLEKIIRFWANRGYINLLIDTHKVSDDSQHDKRWEIFVEDMKTIYRLTRKNAGGCNLRTVVTFQLADSALKSRYLGFDAIGEGKASKNEASVVQMFRPAWSDEYADGKHELECYSLEKKANGEGYDKKFFKLEKGKTYYLLFTPKNRFGANNDNGQAVMVIEPFFHRNSFAERGWTFVAKDYN